MDPQKITEELKLWNLQNNISGHMPVFTVPKIEYFMPEIKDTAEAEYTKETFNTRAHNMGAPQSIEQSNEQFKQKILACLERLGIYLRADETLALTLDADRLIRVSGLHDEANAQKLADELNIVKKTGIGGTTSTARENAHVHTFYLNSAYAREAENYGEANRRANLIKLKDTAQQTIREQTGEAVDIAKLRKTADGKIEGYPASLAWVFRKDYDALDADEAGEHNLGAALAVEHTVNLLLDAGCDSIPNVEDIDVAFEYTYKDFLDFEVKG